MTFTIVIPVYKRIESFKRLIQSILNAHISVQVNLIISIEEGAPLSVLNFCATVEWVYGDFEIIKQNEHLGVDNHNIECMKLALKHGSIIILEDDHIVSPFFIDYLNQTIHLMENSKVYGISLYTYSKNEVNFFPFDLIPNEEFIYYQKRPSSRGCFYTDKVVEEYLEFKSQFKEDYDGIHLPDNVKKWNNKVWEKSFYAFLINANGYLVFPRYSFSTNMGEPGVHMNRPMDKFRFQSKLYLSDTFLNIKTIENSINVYDQFCELESEQLKLLYPELNDFDFEIDLYGLKDLNLIKTRYLISSKVTANAVLSWDRIVKPPLLNIISHQVGNFISLGLTSSFEQKDRIVQLREDFEYYYPDVSLLNLLKMKFLEIKGRYYL